MSAPKRVSPQEVRSKLQAGQALLVCAYESDVKSAASQSLRLALCESRHECLPA